ncbi:hypothetical protein ACIP6X_04940 [Streptomyces coeruleorubidus]|uniref:hypothetical protein n=1 Tax=Streptomyces coeruleorubidus TaxID=116188 RepID=UPI003819A54F
MNSARKFVRRGRRLPAHEVAYEQSIVAPLLDLLVDAHTLTGDPPSTTRWPNGCRGCWPSAVRSSTSACTA